MAKIPDGSFKDWKESEVVHAQDYKQEREVLRIAINDNDTRLGAAESDIDKVESRATALETRATSLENDSDSSLRTDITALQNDTYKKTETFSKEEAIKAANNTNMGIIEYRSGNINVPINGTATLGMSFATPFTAPPTVVGTLNGSISGSLAGLTLRIANVTSLGCNICVDSTGVDGKIVIVHLLAFGKIA